MAKRSTRASARKKLVLDAPEPTEATDDTEEKYVTPIAEEPAATDPAAIDTRATDKEEEECFSNSEDEFIAIVDNDEEEYVPPIDEDPAATDPAATDPAATDSEEEEYVPPIDEEPAATEPAAIPIDEEPAATDPAAADQDEHDGAAPPTLPPLEDIRTEPAAVSAAHSEDKAQPVPRQSEAEFSKCLQRDWPVGDEIVPPQSEAKEEIVPPQSEAKEEIVPPHLQLAAPIVKLLLEFLEVASDHLEPQKRATCGVLVNGFTEYLQKVGTVMLPKNHPQESD
jgi:hypothetical protein